MTDMHQWVTAVPLLAGGAPPWASQMDQWRIGSYMLYEQIYWTVPSAFRLVVRGDTNAIYIPTGRQIVDTMHRYLAPQLAVVADPSLGTQGDQQALFAAWEAMRRRERFYSKFSTAKRYGLIRGDAILQIEADPTLPPGSRLTIKELDPGMYFPIEHPDDPDVIIGVKLAWQFIDEQGKPFVQALTYRKTTGLSGPSPITIEEAIYEPDKWWEGAPFRQITPVTELPAQITSIPVYHISNFSETGTRWGSSEMRGIERLLTALNQSISDEDLELVMNGLGIYVTDAGAPINPNTGETDDWTLGPAKVLEIPPGMKFGRVSGTSTVAPYQEHLKYMHDQIDQTFGMSATAKGRVDVSVAESGVALALEMGPILARAEDKELVISDVLTNFLYDIRAWLNAYEAVPLTEAVLIPTYGPKLPQNNKERFDEIMSLFAAKVVSGIWVREELSKIGFAFPDDTTMMDQILAEEQLRTDVVGARLDQEVASDNGQVPEGVVQ